MPTDVFLNENDVVVEGGAALILRAADLHLSHSERLPPEAPKSALRRALVHGEGDVLIVNFGADYSNGVEISGEVNFSGRVNLPGHSTVQFPPGPTLGAGPIAAPLEDGPGVDLGHVADISESDLYADPGDDPIELASEIRRLRHAILRLNERLTSLEGA